MFADAAPAYTSLVVGSVTTTRGAVTQGNTTGHTAVSVNVGTLSASLSATIRFRIQIAAVLPTGVTQVSNQGTASSNDTPGHRHR